MLLWKTFNKNSFKALILNTLRFLLRCCDRIKKIPFCMKITLFKLLYKIYNTPDTYLFTYILRNTQKLIEVWNLHCVSHQWAQQVLKHGNQKKASIPFEAQTTIQGLVLFWILLSKWELVFVQCLFIYLVVAHWRVRGPCESMQA